MAHTSDSEKKIISSGKKFYLESIGKDRASGISGGKKYGEGHQQDEKEMIEQVLRECDGKTAKASEKLGISRQLLYYTESHMKHTIKMVAPPYIAAILLFYNGQFQQ